MRRTAIALLGVALVGCVPGGNFEEEPTQPLTQLSLTGEGGQLHLKGGCQTDASYRAVYDNPKNVARMELRLFANGTIEATCYDARDTVTECSDAPIIASVSVDPGRPAVAFIDLLGKLIANYEGEGNSMVAVADPGEPAATETPASPAPAPTPPT
jgi:hypothetical protein